MPNVVIKRPVKGYEGLYEVTNTGLVYGCKSGVFLSPKSRKDGYLEVNLWRNGVGTSHLVHKLVAEAFVPNPNYFPQINHKDENKSNNNADNLEWCTAKYNSRYGTGNKRGVKLRRIKCCNCKPVRNVNTGKTYTSIDEAAKDSGICRANIGRVCDGQRKTAGGYKWEWWYGP